MARKPKARGAKKKAPAKKMTKSQQSRAFLTKARELGVDETGEEFERAFRRVAAPVRPSVKRPSS